MKKTPAPPDFVIDRYREDLILEFRYDAENL